LLCDKGARANFAGTIDPNAAGVACAGRLKSSSARAADANVAVQQARRIRGAANLTSGGCRVVEERALRFAGAIGPLASFVWCLEARKLGVEHEALHKASLGGIIGGAEPNRIAFSRVVCVACCNAFTIVDGAVLISRAVTGREEHWARLLAALSIPNAGLTIREISSASLFCCGLASLVLA
jgi:hypothetical protein